MNRMGILSILLSRLKYISKSRMLLYLSFEASLRRAGESSCDGHKKHKKALKGNHWSSFCEFSCFSWLMAVHSCRQSSGKERQLGIAGAHAEYREASLC